MRVDKSKWEKRRLGELCNIKRGGSPRPIKKFLTNDTNGINWIKIGDATDSKYISSCKEKIVVEGMKKSRFVHKGDFLLSNSMSFGRPYILNVDGCIHDGWLVLEHPTSFNTSFLYYLLSSSTMYEKFAQKAQGAVVNNLNIERVAGVEVAFPSKAEQQSIAHELDAVQAMIDGYRQQISDLDSLAQSIFYDMFGDPKTNENNWELFQLGDVCSMRAGKNIKASELSDNFRDGLYPCYGGNGLRGYIDHFSHEGKTVIIGRQGALCGNVNIVEGKFYATEHAVPLSPILPQTTEFVYYMLKEYNLNRFAKGSAQPGLSVGHISKKYVPLPPLNLQQQFSTRIEKIEQQKAAYKQQLQDAETLMAERMQYYFS